MCDFCKNIESGDDYNPLIASEIDLGFAGKLFADVVLTRSTNGNATLSLFNCMDSKDNNITETIKIKFCPICGRELI